MARLKSTLTFEDFAEVADVCRAVTRIDEEDSEALELEESVPSTPVLAADSQELVLCPANLCNGD